MFEKGTHMYETDSIHMYQLLGAALNYIQCMKGAGCIDYVGGRRHQPDIDSWDFTYYDCYHSYELEIGYVNLMNWIEEHC